MMYFQVPLPDSGTLAWEEGEGAQNKGMTFDPHPEGPVTDLTSGKLKFGIRYPVMASLVNPQTNTATTHGLWLDPKNNKFTFCDRKISNALVELYDPNDRNDHGKFVPEDHRVALKFYYPAAN